MQTSLQQGESNGWIRLAMSMAVLLAGIGLSGQVQAEDLKIGYVDLHRALNNVPEGKKAKKQLKKDYQSKQQKLNEKQKEVRKLKKELQSQSMALSKEAKKKKQKKLRKKMRELQQMYMGLQRNLSQKEAKETKEIFDKMRKVVEKIADEKGYDMVLEKSKGSVVYADESLDLTEELIERFKSDSDSDEE